MVVSRSLASPFELVRGRDIWVVKCSGVEVPFSIPDIPGVVIGEVTAGDVLYAYVDASTGGMADGNNALPELASAGIAFENPANHAGHQGA